MPQPLLSVVIPAYNAAEWLPVCLSHLERAVARSGLTGTEVIVVDDGSEDGTAQAAEKYEGFNVAVIRQANAGRFIARQKGMAAATGDFLLLLDTRVLIDEDALRFVASHWSSPESSVWTAHVEISTVDNQLGRFWRCIEEVAWRRYWASPRTTSYGIDEFDYYPKGTTAFIAPRKLLIDAVDAFVPTVVDWKRVNDDTALLRFVAERLPINISPHYRVTYHARSNVSSFLRHANHRGSVLIDGYLRPGTRFAVPIALVLAGAPVGVGIACARPRLSATVLFAGSIGSGVAARCLGARTKDAALVGVLAPGFGTVYLAGMYRGLMLRARSTVLRRAPRPSNEGPIR